MLPVLSMSESIVSTLQRDGRLVLVAPTGSGKTTQVPQIIYRAALVPHDQRIVILQPRRLATRMVASRVAFEMQSPGGLGGLVGYQTRHDSAVSAATRIVFMTEALLLRHMQSDMQLSEIGAVVLDEFHERNLPADLVLAMLRSVQRTSRPDLKLAVMSATIDAQVVADYLSCTVLQASGRQYPVEVRYLQRQPNSRTEQPWHLAANALREALTAMPSGDVLIFMPGAYEIARTIEHCERAITGLSQPIRFCPLHGSLPRGQQDQVIQAWPDGRKVIVATNVAETSITIDGVTCVIDSGLARMHRHDARRGINALHVEPISKASAEQRAGRAGRTAPGLCLRLWTARDHAHRADHDPPEVHRLELSEAVLTLKTMGVTRVQIPDFHWLTPPRPESVNRAESLLRKLGAEDDHGNVTAMGRTMARFPVHPRLARFMIEAASMGCLKRAITWAAIINERELFSPTQQSVLLRFLAPDEPRSDLAAIEFAYEELKSSDFSVQRCRDTHASPQVCRDIERTARQLSDVCKQLGLSFEGENRTAALLSSLLVAYSDHLAVKLDRLRLNCAMPGRRNVTLDRESVVQEAGPIIALDIHETSRGRSAHTILALANPIDVRALERIDPAGLVIEHHLTWNEEALAAECVETLRYHELILEQTARPPSTPTDQHAASAMIVERIMAGTLRLDHWNEHVRQWIARSRCVSKWFPEIEITGYDEDDIRVILHEIVGDSHRFGQVRDQPCLEAVRGALSWEQQRFIERMAPAAITLPRGRPLKIVYSDDGPEPQARARARIQELYDLEDSPRVADGRVPVLIEILAPNQRPVQVTRDLRGFWTTLYPELKKQLQRRYPRHEWR